MEKYHPNSLYSRFAVESNGYFYRWQHGNVDADDEEENQLYKVPLYDLNWKDRTVGSIVQQYGLQLAQARRPRASIAEYWKASSVGPLTCDNYGQYCSRNRFNLHQKFFYINAAQPEDFDEHGVLADKFHKVRPVLEKYKLCNDLGITFDFWPYGGSGSIFPGQPD